MTFVRSLIPCLVSFLLVGVSGCTDKDTSEFKDQLTFGSALGPTGFDLINEGTSFSLASTDGGTLWFKLESAQDMGGRAVRLYVNNGTYATKDYTNPQSYGHMLLSSFRITDTGSFSVKGLLVEQIGPDIGKETLVDESTVTMQP